MIEYHGGFGLLWYIFPVDCLVGVILVELVFFPAKKPKMTAGRWCMVGYSKREIRRPTFLEKSIRLSEYQNIISA